MTFCLPFDIIKNNRLNDAVLTICASPTAIPYSVRVQCMGLFFSHGIKHSTTLNDYIISICYTTMTMDKHQLIKCYWTLHVPLYRQTSLLNWSKACATCSLMAFMDYYRLSDYIVVCVTLTLICTGWDTMEFCSILIFI